MAHTFFIQKPPTAKDVHHNALDDWLNTKLETAAHWIKSEITLGVNVVKRSRDEFSHSQKTDPFPLPFLLWNGFQKLIHQQYEKEKTAPAHPIFKQTQKAPPHSIAIIGGGASAAILAMRLAERSAQSALNVYLIEGEPNREIGRGKAYSGYGLLNVRAGNMSAFPERPDDFFNWLQAKHPEKKFDRNSFVERKIYGQYLGDRLKEAEQKHSSDFHLSRIHQRGVGLKKLDRGYQIQLANGELVESNQTVLALGNFDSAPPLPIENVSPGFYEGPHFTNNPYKLDLSKKKFGKGETVVLIGAGLTAVDAAIETHKESPETQIILLSRSGELPRPHGPSNPLNTKEAENFRQAILQENTADGIRLKIRAQIQQMPNPKEDWRSVIDALRPITPKIWRSLPDDQKEKFLKHYAREWGVHRHRIPPESNRIIQEMIATGKLRIINGALEKIKTTQKEVQLVLSPEKTGDEKTILRASHVINCTGPDTDYVRISSHDRFVASLLNQGLAKTDRFKLGLIANDQYQLQSAAGDYQDGLYGIGSVILPRDYEGLAIPELRGQAIDLANQIVKSVSAVNFQNNTLPLTNAALFIRPVLQTVLRPPSLLENEFTR